MKKFLIGSLTVMTVVWAMGLSAFVAVPASAAVGDLVKSASSSTVYVVKADGVTICQFPHANVYKSWGYPSNFSTVMTKDLSSYTVGSNIEFRDASLVKGDGPAVYLVYNNMKRPIVSDVVFLALGYDWDDITWLSDAFLADYTTGAVVDSSTMHPDGQIVKYAGNSAVYLIDNGMKRPFASGAAYEANRYSWGDIITIPDTETYPNGSAISGYEQALSLPNCIGASAAPVGSGLSVALSPSTPAASSIIVDITNLMGQALVPFTTVNFTASSDGDVRVNTLKFKRTGISSDTSLNNMYLYDGNTKLTDGGSLSSGMVTFNSANGLFTVPAGTTKSITVKGDVSSTATAGQTIGFQLFAASDVTTNGGAVSGSFPATGNNMTVAAVSDLAKVGVATTSVPTSVEPDTQEQVVWQGTVYTSNQKVGLHYIKLTSLGSIQADDLKNFKLYDGGTLVATVAAMNSDREVIFDIMSNPINFNQGQSKSLKVLADIVKGSTRTYNFTIQEATDVVAKDQNYNVFVTPTVTSNYTSWVVLKMTTDTQIQSGTLTVTKANTSPVGNVSQDGTNVKVATFEFKATGEDMKVQNLNVKANFTSGYEGGLDNGKLYFNGVQVGATKDLTENQSINFTFGSSLIVSAGTTGVLDIYADIRSATGTQITNSSQFVVSIEAGSSNVQKMASLDYTSAPSGSVPASTLSVSAAALTAAKYAAYTDQTFVAGSVMAKVGSAVLTSGSAEGVNVTSVTVSTTALMAASTTNMMLKDGSTQLGITKVNPGASNIFSVNLNIPASGSKVVDIYADIKSGAAAGDMYFGLSAEGVGLVTNNTVSTVAEAVLQKITVGSGGLTATVDASRPNADIVLAGTTGVLMNAVKFSAQYEDFQVQELRVVIDSNLQPHVNSVTLEYPTQNGTATAVGYPASGAVNFTGLTMFVPRDSSAVLKIYIDVPSLSSGTISGATGSVDFDVNAGYRHVGLGSGTTETTGTNVAATDITGNDMVVRKSRPTVTLVSLGTSTLNAGEQDISKFTISADAKGSIEIAKLHWDVATTTAKLKATSPQLFESTDLGTVITASGTATFTETALTYSIKNPVNHAIGAGQSKTFVLTGFVILDTGTNTVSTRLKTPAATDTGLLNALLASDGMLWSDLSASQHATTTADWATAQYVKTLPTSYQTLTVTN